MSASEQKRVQDLERQIALIETQKKNLEAEIAYERALRDELQMKLAQSATGPSGLTVAELDEFAVYSAGNVTAWTLPKAFGRLLERCGLDACRKFAALVIKTRPRMKASVPSVLARAERVYNLSKLTGKLPADWRSPCVH